MTKKWTSMGTEASRKRALDVTRREKRARKKIEACGYTPMISRTLASLLCTLAEKSEIKQNEVLQAFSSIVRGKMK